MQGFIKETLSYYSHTTDVDGYTVTLLLVLILVEEVQVQVYTLKEVTGPTTTETCFKSTEKMAKDIYLLETMLEYITLTKQDTG